MNKHLFCICLALWGLSLPAQAQWQWLNPQPNVYSGQVVRFVDADHGFVLQTTGTLLATDDAGQHWHESRHWDGAADLDFAPGGVGFLLNKAGVLWRSPDAGRNWTRVSGAPQMPLNPYDGPQLQHVYARIHAVSADTLFEVATDGTIRRSVDGGRAWQGASVSSERGILSSFFVSGKIGFVGAGNGRIYKTTTGGATWTLLSEVNYFPSEITMLYFVNTRLGFAHREHSDLLRTTDGGLTWTVLPSRLEDITDIQFVTPERGVAVGDYGVIYTTDDAGLSWTPRGAALHGLYAGDYWSSVRFTSATTGYVTGRGRQGAILRTTDGGQTWQSVAARLGTISALSFPGHGLVGYAQSGDGVLKTLDGGDTWTVLPQGGGGNAMVCLDAQTVLVAGGSEVARTDDGGQTWTRVRVTAPYTSTNLVSLAMADRQTGYVSGDWNGLDQVLARTTDGGRTWQNITSFAYNGLGHLTFPTPQTGFAVRSDELYKTSDAGQSWQPVTSLHPYNGVKDVCFVDAQVGYVVDDARYIHKTTDGGQTWVSTPLLKSRLGFDGHPVHVRFRDRDAGCVQDDNGGIYRTSDGGRTWLVEFNMGSRALDYTFGGQALVLGGYNGMLVRRSLITNTLPFESQMLAPVALTDSSVKLMATLHTTNCYIDSLHIEYVPDSAPDFSKAPAAFAYPIGWYTDSIQAWVPHGLLPATTYRARLRLLHNGTRYYSTETKFTTPVRAPLPAPILAAYPNPTTGFLRVAQPQGAPATSIEVFSLNGALLRHGSGRGIDLSGLPSGMYVLRVQAGEQVYRRRIQKL